MSLLSQLHPIVYTMFHLFTLTSDQAKQSFSYASVIFPYQSLGKTDSYGGATLSM
jgi:hypothetical protein